MDINAVNERRKVRLAELVRTRFGGNEAELARALGYTTPGFVRAMLRDDGQSRAITEKTVAKIEALPGLHGWFSRPTENTSEEEFPTNRGARNKPRTSSAIFLDVKSIPVLTFADLSLMEVINSDPRLVTAPRMAASVDAGPRAKAVQIVDDSMAPAMRVGDTLHFDPDVSPSAGLTVLVVDGAGQHHIREYRVRSGGAFEAAAHNPTHATLHSEKDSLRVIAVATHLTQSLIGRGTLLGRTAGSLIGIVGALFLGTALYVGELGPNHKNDGRRAHSARIARRRGGPALC